jgi:hypothetical protein
MPAGDPWVESVDTGALVTCGAAGRTGEYFGAESNKVLQVRPDGKKSGDRGFTLNK